MEFETLPDDCLIALFRQCFLQDLLNHRRVSSRWQILIERMCQQKRSLKLFGTPGTFKRDLNRILFKRMCFNLDNYEDDRLANVTDNDNDDLVIWAEDYFTETQIDQLLSLCPKIELLVVVGFAQPLSNHLVYLIRKLPNLHSLYLQGRLQARASELPSNLCEAINSLEHLRNFSLKLVDFCMKQIHHKLLYQLIPTLNKVEQFAIYHRDCNSDVVPILNLLSPNCTRLSLDCERLALDYLSETLWTDFSTLRENLTHLRLVSVKMEYFYFACQTFPSLQHLDILLAIGLEFFKINSDLIENLRILPSLSELRIAPLILNKEEDFNLIDLSTSFPNIKKLSLTLQTRFMKVLTNFNYDLLFEILPKFFPNLQQIELCTNDFDPIPNLRQKLSSFPYLERCQYNYRNFRLN